MGDQDNAWHNADAYIRATPTQIENTKVTMDIELMQQGNKHPDHYDNINKKPYRFAVGTKVWACIEFTSSHSKWGAATIIKHD